MIRKKVETNLEACRALWDKFMVRRNVTDLWEFRDCFQKHFKNAPHFILLEDEQGVSGFLPLSYLKDKEKYVLLPGETWNGKTWLERTQLCIRTPDILGDPLDAAPARTYLRYLECEDVMEFNPVRRENTRGRLLGRASKSR